MLPELTYYRPSTLKKAIKALEKPGSVIHAGGTDLLGCLHDSVFKAEALISLHDVPELDSFLKPGNGELRIGALTTIRSLATDPQIRKKLTALAQAAGEVASPQLREQGTIGGNLCQKPRCWYYRGEFDCLRKGGPKCFAFRGQNQFHCILGGSGCYIVHPSDTAPALIALDAKIDIRGSKGKRTLAVEALHVPPKENPRRETYLEQDEIITDIRIPVPETGRRSSYRKIRARQAWDFAVAGVALALTLKNDRIDNPRVVLSGAAPVPWRSQRAEEILANEPLTEKTARMAAEEAVKEARPLQHNGYKIDLFKGVIEEELIKHIAA